MQNIQEKETINGFSVASGTGFKLGLLVENEWQAGEILPVADRDLLRIIERL